LIPKKTPRADRPGMLAVKGRRAVQFGDLLPALVKAKEKVDFNLDRQ
jgi:hypothetical protein